MANDEKLSRIDGLFMAAILDEHDPSELLLAIERALHETSDPDVDLTLEIGCGPLETLVRKHGDELWPQIESFARDDPRFRRALSAGMASPSDEFHARREALLAELGEFRTTWVRFVVSPRGWEWS